MCMMPKSGASVMEKAFMLMPWAPSSRATSLMRPVLFSRNKDICFIITLFFIVGFSLAAYFSLRRSMTRFDLPWLRSMLPGSISFTSALMEMTLFSLSASALRMAIICPISSLK